MPNLDWNVSMWDRSSAEWRAEGEDWSSWWGGSEAQWFGSIYPRLHRFLPARRILEIAPGFGRWTRYLLPACKSYVGIDLSGQAITACKERFGQLEQASFFQNDGLSLDDAEDHAFDLIFSFDSLVHAEMEVLEKYIPQIIHKLKDSGVAFVHHSNFFEMAPGTENPHSRAASVSGKKVERVVGDSGGQVLVQEVLNWGGSNLIDCFTLFGTADAYPHVNSIRMCNRTWVDEMNIIREVQSAYSARLSVFGESGGLSSRWPIRFMEHIRGLKRLF